MSTTGPSDPNVEPDQVPDTGIGDPNVEPEQGSTPTTDVSSAPALQPREGEGDMLT
jgi:hypothetical protein